MKTALDLLGKDFNARSEIMASDSKPVGLVEYQLTEAQLETLVRRAREEGAPIPTMWRMQGCECPATAKASERCDRNWTRCQSRMAYMAPVFAASAAAGPDPRTCPSCFHRKHSEPCKTRVHEGDYRGPCGCALTAQPDGTEKGNAP